MAESRAPEQHLNYSPISHVSIFEQSIARQALQSDWLSKDECKYVAF